jgi:hypothetical protein
VERPRRFTIFETNFTDRPSAFLCVELTRRRKSPKICRFNRDSRSFWLVFVSSRRSMVCGVLT